MDMDRLKSNVIVLSEITLFNPTFLKNLYIIGDLYNLNLIMKKFTNVLSAIGDTPLIQLSKVVSSDSANVWIKLEYVNPTGSYKDRMALAMIEGAEARGDLKPGMKVVEFTGGSTGSSLAFICAVKGY